MENKLSKKQLKQDRAEEVNTPVNRKNKSRYLNNINDIKVMVSDSVDDIEYSIPVMNPAILISNNALEIIGKTKSIKTTATKRKRTYKSVKNDLKSSK